MNYWTSLSIEYANSRNYLDELFRVYPTIPEGMRDIDAEIWGRVERAFAERNNPDLLRSLLKLELFPIKDSYVAYLKRDDTALERNPETVNRLCGRLYEMGLDSIYERASQPKETNRQMGQHFRRWLEKGALGIDPVSLDQFVGAQGNAVLRASDLEAKAFAANHLGYGLDKGLDLIARFNGKYVIGEAKFLTDFGGHQNAQFNDGIAPLRLRGLNAIPVAILDGVLYIKGRTKMYTEITTNLQNDNIMSSLVLREFLYHI